MKTGLNNCGVASSGYSAYTLKSMRTGKGRKGITFEPSDKRDGLQIRKEQRIKTDDYQEGQNDDCTLMPGEWPDKDNPEFCLPNVDRHGQSAGGGGKDGKEPHGVAASGEYEPYMLPFNSIYYPAGPFGPRILLCPYVPLGLSDSGGKRSKKRKS